MTLQRDARPLSLAATGRAARTAAVGSGRHSDCSTAAAEVVLVVRKRGKDCRIAKLAVARPLGELAVVVPYRMRQVVGHPSLPPAALQLARQAGRRLWIVRLHQEAECYALPLTDVERRGWLKASHGGKPEWFVDLALFQPLCWQQDWRYVRREVVLDAEHQCSKQLALL